jgi:hypothetical protein
LEALVAFLVLETESDSLLRYKSLLPVGWRLNLLLEEGLELPEEVGSLVLALLATKLGGSVCGLVPLIKWRGLRL